MYLCYMHEHLPAYIYAYHICIISVSGAYRDQIKESDPLGLELGMVLSHHVDAGK